MKLGISAFCLGIFCVAPVWAAGVGGAIPAKTLPHVAPMPAPRPLDLDEEESAAAEVPEAAEDLAALETLAPPEPAWEAKPIPAALIQESERSTRMDRRGRAVPPELRALVARHAQENAVPVGLAHAMVLIESGYNPRLSHAGNLGLMQIKAETARSLGFSGGAAGLLDPETNLRFGMRYLASAWRASGGDLCGAVMRYQSGARAVRMTAASRASCARVKDLMRGA